MNENEKPEIPVKSDEQISDNQNLVANGSENNDEQKKKRARRSPSLPLPYIQSAKNLEKCLSGIVRAAVPEKFTQDFLKDTLKLTGGSATPLIPFLKRIGMVGSGDGIPTQLYKDYKDGNRRSHAAGEILRLGFADLFKYDEKIFEANETKLKEAIKSVANIDENDQRVNYIFACFNILKKDANFDDQLSKDEVVESRVAIEDQPSKRKPITNQFGLSYTINLNLPESANPAVYNAIFKSLREQLLFNDE